MLLDIIGVETSSFGKIQSVTHKLLCYKPLCQGTINELKVSIVDEYGAAININDQPIIVMLQIVKP